MWAISARVTIVVCWLMLASAVNAADLSGSYVAQEDPSVTLALKESADGRVTGTLTEGETSLPLTGHHRSTGFTGTVGPNAEALPFTAALKTDFIVMEIGGPEEHYRFTFRPVNIKQKTASTVVPVQRRTRHVTINGQQIGDKELTQKERTYRIRIPDADYWYDKVLGAWGVRGGPTVGFITPGLELGGSLPADASGGGTGVFVNGRELHPFDMAALQQITGPILPGRYFINAQGLAGFEGGPPLWNLAALAARQAQTGSSHTWQSRITGASGFSDGTTGAVFLPNGGIVSTGD